MSKLEFSEQEQAAAHEHVEDLRNGGNGYHEIAEAAVCRLNRAEELIGRLLGEVCGPFADTTVVPESEVFLTALRSERGEQ